MSCISTAVEGCVAAVWRLCGGCVEAVWGIFLAIADQLKLNIILQASCNRLFLKTLS